MPELVFGRASVDSLSEIWNCSPVLNDIREGLPRRLGGICGGCIMKNFCLGSCIAQNYYRDRDLWAPHWYCHEAHRQGLFPGSRLIRTQAREGGGSPASELQAIRAVKGDSPT